MADAARARREAIWQAAGLRRRLEAAEGALAIAQAAAKQAETGFDAAQDRLQRRLDDVSELRNRLALPERTLAGTGGGPRGPACRAGPGSRQHR